MSVSQKNGNSAARQPPVSDDEGSGAETLVDSEDAPTEDEDFSSEEDPVLDYDDVRETFTKKFSNNFVDNVAPTGMGIESENNIVRNEETLEHGDGIIPSADVYQDILNEDLWEAIHSELEDNVEGYGEEAEFYFDLKQIEEKGHLEERPAAMKFEVEGEPENVLSPIELDFDLGQLELDSGAFAVSEDDEGSFGLALDVLKSIKEGSRRYIEDKFSEKEGVPELVFDDQGLTIQYREPEEVPEEIGDREIIIRGVGEEYDQDQGLEFVKEHGDQFTSVEYYSDYIATIFGPQVIENMFGASTQLTSGLYAEEGEDFDQSDVDQKIAEEMPYRMLFEGAFDVLTSNTYVEDEDGDKQVFDINGIYWGESYGQHSIDEAGVDEEASERFGTPWELLKRLDNSEDGLREMVDYYMTEHNMVWIKPPEDGEYVEIEGDVDYDEVGLLALDPDNPKTPRKFVEDGEVDFTKVWVPEGTENPSPDDLERVEGTLNLEGMSEEEMKEYHLENFSGMHLGGMHHDVRFKPGTGGFEYRVARQNYEDEPAVALAKAAVIPHGDKIREAIESYDESINPADPETVPDYDNKEAWTEIFEEVYTDDDVRETARELAPDYADEFEQYVDKSLENGPPGEHVRRKEPAD
jgi:hypothetical protein